MRESVLEPLQDFLAVEGEPASTQDWLNELQTYPGLTGVQVGIDPDDVLVLELEWSESFELSFDGVEIDNELDSLGIAGDAGFSPTMSGTWTAATTVKTSADGDSTWLIDPAFSIRAAWTDNVAAPATIGLLSTAASEWSGDVSIETSWTDSDPNGDGQISGEEAIAPELENVVHANDFQMELTLVSEVAGLVGTSPTVLISAEAIDVSENETTVSVTDFETAELFNHVDAERIVAGLLLASDWLSIVQADPLFEVGLPFVEGITINETLDLGAAFSEYIDARLVTAERNANFADFDELAERLLTDWTFDPVAQTVTLPINRALLVDTFDAPITFPSAASSDSSIPLADLSTSAEATIAGVGRFAFDFVIDLSPEFADVPSDQTTTVADQVSLSDTSIQWQLNTLDHSMTGSARYGMIGFDFTGRTSRSNRAGLGGLVRRRRSPSRFDHRRRRRSCRLDE